MTGVQTCALPILSHEQDSQTYSLFIPYITMEMVEAAKPPLYTHPDYPLKLLHQYGYTVKDGDLYLLYSCYDSSDASAGFLHQERVFLYANPQSTLPYADILEAYRSANPEAEDVRIYDYGTYGDGARVAIIDDARLMYTQMEEEHRIGPAIIRYSDGCFMQVLYNGVFYSLADAYGSGLLSDADMAALENLQRERAPYLYADDE